MVFRYLFPRLSSTEDTSIHSSSELSSSPLQQREEEWLVLRDRYPRLPSPLIMNNNFSASCSLGVMNDFGGVYCVNWVAPGKWVVM